jgi:hypothetical protein
MSFVAVQVSGADATLGRLAWLSKRSPPSRSFTLVSDCEGLSVAAEVEASTI